MSATLVRATRGHETDFLEQHVLSEISNIDHLSVDAASPCDPINTAVTKPQECVAMQPPSYQNVLDIHVPCTSVNNNMTQNMLDLGLQHFQTRDFSPKFGTAHTVAIDYNFHSPHDYVNL